MKALASLLILAAAVLPPPAHAQERDVTRKQYTFIDNRLDVAVLADAPGVLQVVRGERGRVEVAARTRDGFAGSALGGNVTRELRLTAVGADAVHYLVVVPERVSVRILLPEGRTMTLAPSASAGTWEWGTAARRQGTRAAAPAAAEPTDAAAVGQAAQPVQPGRAPQTAEYVANGMYTAHRDTWAPEVITVPDLAAVRSLSVRFEGGEFRVASSRPLVVQPGSRSHLELRLDGEPVDVVIHVPRGRADFALTSGGQTIARSAADQPVALCRNVVVHTPTAEQTWFTFYPQAGRLECR